MLWTLLLPLSINFPKPTMKFDSIAEEAFMLMLGRPAATPKSFRGVGLLEFAREATFLQQTGTAIILSMILYSIGGEVLTALKILQISAKKNITF